MLTVKEVAAQLNVSPQIIYSLISSGKLNSYRIGAKRGTIRVSQEDLESFLRDARVEVEQVVGGKLKFINL